MAFGEPAARAKLRTSGQARAGRFEESIGNARCGLANGLPYSRIAAVQGVDRINAEHAVLHAYLSGGTRQVLLHRDAGKSGNAHSKERQDGQR